MSYRLREPQITLDEIKQRVRRTGFICYGMRSCWWAEDTFYTLPKEPGDRMPGLPVDPAGRPLMQVADGSRAPDGRLTEAMEFIRMAERNPSHYGRHGINAFIAAYHGNVLTEDGKPWCLKEWGDYNALLDAIGASATGATVAPSALTAEGAVPAIGGETPEGDK